MGEPLRTPPPIPPRSAVLDGEDWISDPRAHGDQLHGGGRGVVALCQRMQSGYWREKVYPVEVALEILRSYSGRENVYLSMQRFQARRRIAKLLSLSSLYADIDYYGTDLEGTHPAQVLDLAMERLQREGIPSPTLAISSGYGLYLIWQH